VNDPRFGRAKKYQGSLQLMEGEFGVCYDEKTLRRGGGQYPSTIFIDHCNDLWAESVPNELIIQVVDHCVEWPDNTYVYQTKNPARYIGFIPWMPPKCLLGCTIETNWNMSPAISVAPRPLDRYEAMLKLRGKRKLFVTIEPIMDFDLADLVTWIILIRPEFVNIGADSKGHKLPEPSSDKVRQLIRMITAAGIEIREKHNLGRLLK
jgi:protein gp37